MAIPDFSTGEVLTAAMMDRVGLWKVIPTGATNGTVGTNGTVTIGNAVASVTVSGVFSSSFDNYRIALSGGTTSAATQFLLQFGSSTTEYYGSWYYDLYTGNGTGTLRRDNGANLYVGNTGGVIAGRTHSMIDVFSPNKAERTTISGMNYGAGYSGWCAGEQFTTTVFTAFTLLVATGTMTGGTIQVYGYNSL
jgi:hypothetical protein